MFVLPYPSPHSTAIDYYVVETSTVIAASEGALSAYVCLEESYSSSRRRGAAPKQRWSCSRIPEPAVRAGTFPKGVASQLAL